jgi:hypothetical protein
MKSIRGFALGLTLGVAIAIATVGFAQTTQTTNPANQKAQGGAMISCCCQGGSCAMHQGEGHSEAQMKAHAKMQSDKMKQNSAEGGCCCCGGDSCDMQMKMKKENKED